VRLGWASAVVLVAATGMQAAAAAANRDRIPPAFAGLRSATTCIPGPVGVERMSSYRLVWPAAKDDVTPVSRLVYDVYQTTSRGGENFSAPTYTTRRGATSFATPPLSSTSTVPYYFVVRARDAAGNRDRNRRERPGRNLCL
jgi:hypothetical protein